MADKSTYYDCECKYYEDHTIICKTCEEWMDKVGKTIQEHGVDKSTFGHLDADNTWLPHG